MDYPDRRLYGYGIKLNPLESISMEGVLKLLKKAPVYDMMIEDAGFHIDSGTSLSYFDKFPFFTYNHVRGLPAVVAFCSSELAVLDYDADFLLCCAEDTKGAQYLLYPMENQRHILKYELRHKLDMIFHEVSGYLYGDKLSTPRFYLITEKI